MIFCHLDGRDILRETIDLANGALSATVSLLLQQAVASQSFFQNPGSTRTISAAMIASRHSSGASILDSTCDEGGLFGNFV